VRKSIIAFFFKNLYSPAIEINNNGEIQTNIMRILQGNWTIWVRGRRFQAQELLMFIRYREIAQIERRVRRKGFFHLTKIRINKTIIGSPN